VYQNIERLRPGDLVVATDPATGETRLARVAQTYERVTYHLRHLVLQDAAGDTQHIETTDEHPFFLVGINDFVPAERLRVGDNLRGPLGEVLFVIETRYEPHPEGVPVFNLEVEDLHTYYIAAHGARAPPVWVHNRCSDWNDFQRATKGHFKSRAQAAFVWKAWSKGTFAAKTDSILYHWQKHGNGRTLCEYTVDALRFWSTHRAHAVWGTWNARWAPSWKLKIGAQAGYNTATGQILTYWD
jgi:hypothetical protein